jgi:hypothetical protein
MKALPSILPSCPQKSELSSIVVNYIGLSARLVGSDRVKSDVGSSAAKIVIINHYNGNMSEEFVAFPLFLPYGLGRYEFILSALIIV